jgi:hypothetical protein
MKRVLAIAGISAMVGLVAFSLPSSVTAPPKTAQVSVHCPAGGKAAFVTPESLHIALRDSVEWRTTGQVTTSSLDIALKDTTKTWPFSGPLPRGESSAASGDAQHTGTYAYKVTMDCRMPSGSTQTVVIDPDIIIE